VFLVRSGGVAVPESFSVDYGTTEVVPFPRIVTREIALAVLARTLSHETRKEAWLSQIASHVGADTERLVKDAVLLLLERMLSSPLLAHRTREKWGIRRPLRLLERDVSLLTSRARDAREMGHPSSHKCSPFKSS
jgi:hypothetical protein